MSKLSELERIVKETPNDSLLGTKVRALVAEWLKPKQQKEQPYPTFELLNSEGPILFIKRTPEHFLMYDEWKFMIGKMSAKTLISFLHGNSTVRDSKDRVWNYAEQHSGMKRSHDELMAFIEPLIKK